MTVGGAEGSDEQRRIVVDEPHLLPRARGAAREQLFRIPGHPIGAEVPGEEPIEEGDGGSGVVEPEQGELIEIVEGCGPPVERRRDSTRLAGPAKSEAMSNSTQPSARNPERWSTRVELSPGKPRMASITTTTRESASGLPSRSTSASRIISLAIPPDVRSMRIGPG